MKKTDMRPEVERRHNWQENVAIAIRAGNRKNLLRSDITRIHAQLAMCGTDYDLHTKLLTELRNANAELVTL